jgi:hypothetical protein
MRLILVAGFCLSAAACSPNDQDRLNADARAAGHDAAVTVRHGAAEAEVKTGEAMMNAGADAKRAGEQARADSSGQTRP